jgi:hypothetical protein
MFRAKGGFVVYIQVVIYVLLALRDSVLGFIEDFSHLVNRPLEAISNLKRSVAMALKGCLT